jgi:hypothetical protein
MINRDKQNVKSKFDLPLAIILSLMIFDGNLGCSAQREFAGRVGVKRRGSDFRRAALKMKQDIAETFRDVLFDIDKGA